MILYVLFWCGGACSENMEIAASKAPGELLNWGDTQKMKLSWRVVQESMRLMPPVQASFRVAPHDMSFDGFRIPKSWKVDPLYICIFLHTDLNVKQEHITV